MLEEEPRSIGMNWFVGILEYEEWQILEVLETLIIIKFAIKTNAGKWIKV